MLTDLNKAISGNITYNEYSVGGTTTPGPAGASRRLDRPQEHPAKVGLPAGAPRRRRGNTLQYIYDAGGSKLAQVVTYGTAQEQTDYSGAYQYKEDALQQIMHEEGRVVYNNRKDIYINDGDNTANVTAVNATVSTLMQNGNQTYLKITSTSTTARSGILPVGGTFTVSPGDKYLIRAKGYWGSNAVYVTAKANGTDIVWPGATLPAGAAAEAWVEETITIPMGTTQLTAGLNWANVTNGAIFYVNDFQIIKLTTGSPEYQYNLKDHLGNVRLTFTTKPDQDVSLATLETANAATEQGEFLNYTEAVIVNSSIFDHTHHVTPTDTTFYSTRLMGKGTADSIGLAKSLSVMPGDTLNIQVYAKYLDPTSSNWTAAMTSFIASIASGGGAPPGTIIDGGLPGSLGNNIFPYAGFMAYDDESDNSSPRAYLNYLIFDRNYVYKGGGFKRVSSAAKEDGQDVTHELLSFSNIIIKEPGYVYIWLSNENATPVEVFFDDLKVTQGKSAVVQTEDYYPFGLAFNSYQRENSFSNKYQYNGKENVNDLGLGWDDYGARMYMPEIGRFGTIDDYASHFAKYSPYSFAVNNPILFKDNDGNYPVNIVNAEGKLSEGIKHLINISLGISNTTLSNTVIEYEKNTTLQPHHNITGYASGSGGITLGATIVWTDDFDTKGQSLDQSRQDVLLWFASLPHELRHRVQREEMLRNSAVYLGRYGLQSVGAAIVNGSVDANILHDKIPMEAEAIEAQGKFDDFVKFFNYKDEKGNDRNKIVDLFSGGKKDDDFIISKLNRYKAQYDDAKAAEERKKTKGVKSMIKNFSSTESGSYTWNGSGWVRQ